MKSFICIALFVSVVTGEGEEELGTCGNLRALWRDKVDEDIIKLFLGKCKEGCPVADDYICPRQDVTFWLYTSNRRNNPVKLDGMHHSPHLGFVKGVPLKILIHGYTMDKDTAINEELRPAYFARGEYNIISVDWSPLCRDKCYVQAACSVPTVGHCVALFISRVLRVHHGQFSSVHLLGHSMGAHVSAWASNELELPRLTEFDPALPLFTNHNVFFKKGKADVVDVWHSNVNLKGRKSSDGTVDIYFNAGMDQPGCYCNAGCSHLRAVQYYAETIYKSQSLTAFHCNLAWKGYRRGKCPVPDEEDLAEFGEKITPGRTGTYLAFTKPEIPFILPGYFYLNEFTFKSFKRMGLQNCRRHGFTSYIADLFKL